MSKEADKRDEILEASPLLDTFLNYSGPFREARIEKLTKKSLEKIIEVVGERYVDGSIATFSLVSLFTEVIVASSDKDDSYFDYTYSVGKLFFALGSEIGKTTTNIQDILPFTRAIAERAISTGLVRGLQEGTAPNDLLSAIFDTGSTSQDNVSKQVVVALVSAGALASTQNDSGLAPYKNFLNSID